MAYSLEVIVFWLLLIDSVAATLLAWSGEGPKWWKKNFRIFSRYFPLVKGWATLYLVLVLWLGFVMHKLGAF